MIALLTCSKCGKVHRVGNGRIDLTCQDCGGYDFRLGSPIIASPILPRGGTGRREEFGIDSSFTGKHENGSSWLVEVVREWKTKETDSEVVVEEKPSLARTVRKLRAKVS